MFPSPSWGSPPKRRGASVKFWTRALTTTARLVWRAPLRGETISTLGSPGSGSAWAAGPAPPPPAKATTDATAAAAREDGEDGDRGPHRGGRLRVAPPGATGAAAPTPNVCRCAEPRSRRSGRCSSSGSTAQTAPGAGLADRVDVFAGTEPGAGAFGGGHNFPGATMPFGMVQWGPDTVPADRHSGGYDYRDRHLRGFSLTHLSGAGCALYGDFPFLPSDRAAARFSGGPRRRPRRPLPAGLLPRGRARPPRPLLGPPQPGRRRCDRRRADRHHPHRHGSLRLPPLAARQRPDRRRRQRQSRRPRRSADRPRQARDLRFGLQRLLLRPAASLPGLLRRRLRPPPRRLRHLDAPEAGAGLDRRGRPQAGLDRRGRHRPGGRLRQLRHPPQPGRQRPRRRLLRQRRRGARQPRRREPRRLVSARSQPRRRPAGIAPSPRSGSAAAAAATSRPSTRRSTTPCSRRAPSTTPTAATSAWTAPSTTPAAAPSTPTSRAGTSTGRRSRCWRC